MSEAPEGEVALVHAPAPKERAPTPAPLIFALVAGLCAAAFAVPVVLIASNALVPPITAVSVPSEDATTSRTAAPVPAAIRVVSASASAQAVGTGRHEVSFVWVLEGARVGDAATLRFFVGSTLAAEEQGTLDASVFSATTGQLRLTTTQNCSAEGWSAELVRVRSQTPQGERIARAAGVPCT